MATPDIKNQYHNFREETNEIGLPEIVFDHPLLGTLSDESRAVITETMGRVGRSFLRGILAEQFGQLREGTLVRRFARGIEEEITRASFDVTGVVRERLSNQS